MAVEPRLALEGYEDAAHFIGFAGATVFSVNPVAGSMDKVDWQPATGASIIGYGFADHGEKFVLLDSTGALSILNYKGEAATGAAFEFAGKVQITTADLTTMPTGSQLQLDISAADDKVYVSDPLPPIAYADSTMGVPFSNVAHKKVCESFAKKILAQSHEKIGAELLVHTMHVQNVNVFEGIIEAAKEAKGDVIVMASNKNTGLKGILLGSETHAVIVHSNLPVLVLG